MNDPFDTLLLTRFGRAVLPLSQAGWPSPPEPRVADWLRALDVELIALGFVLTHRARSALGRLDGGEVALAHAWLVATLGGSVGAGQKHVPLFRRFPDDVPKDTHELWLKKFVGFYIQHDDQPCLWCDGLGQTHVLSPCAHVVCDRCFDGSNYSACPVCERQVDRSSPFFTAVPPIPSLWENVVGRLGLPVAGDVKPEPTTSQLKRIDLAGPRDIEARALLVSLALRSQAMSPDDVTALRTVVACVGDAVLAWLPAKIPARENVAHIFGTLIKHLPPDQVLQSAGPWLRTATDLLRVIAVWSGADAALQPVTKRVPVLKGEAARWSGAPAGRWIATDVNIRRFKVAKMGRPLRMALLSWLDALPESALLEDVARHRSAWVGVGEVLHPGEYRKRWPRAARAFQVARGVERFVGFAAQSEALQGDTAALAAHLSTRPGELWRRADDALRDARDPAPIVAALLASVSLASLPTLLTVASHLRHRDARWPVRVYFPKGAQFRAPSTGDSRPLLTAAVCAPLLAAMDDELLDRFSRLPRFERAILDRQIDDIVVPFNERTAARAAVALPRGSRLSLPDGSPGDRLRLFLHWCEPAQRPGPSGRGGTSTDIDLSVAFYNAGWEHTGVCSYYELNLAPTAVHSGDLRDAPPPDGATEFVDLDRTAARAAGHRFAVMVVNAYSGLSFSDLSRAFAGVMFRTVGPGAGPHFDPATVELKFDVTGPHGIYVPLVLDLDTNQLCWLDVSSKGKIALNNVATSNATISSIGTDLLAYFGHGVRPSMFDLATLHAVARTDEIVTRHGATTQRFTRRASESRRELLARVRAGVNDDGVDTDTAGDRPVFAALLRGDLDLPAGSSTWALFRGQCTDLIAASDLLSVPNP